MEKAIQKAKRDRRLLRELLIEYSAFINAVVSRFLWDSDMKDDVIQNILMKVIRSIGGFKGTCTFSTWLYRIAVNECVAFNRSEMRHNLRIASRHDGVDIFPDPNAPDGLRSSIRGEQLAAIAESISRLPEGMQQAFRLFYEDGLSGAEAAERLGISEKTLFVRLSDARKRIRLELQRKGVVPL